MKMMLIMIGIGVLQSWNADASTPSIYGKDNRKDLYQISNPLILNAAHAAVALFESSVLEKKPSGSFAIKAGNLQQAQGVCAEERYSDQPAGAFCSGFLVSKNIVLTAGHCITTEEDCKNTRFVFDYSIKSERRYPTTALAKNVYHCKQLLYSRQVRNSSDFAVIQLDRYVKDRSPLVLNRERTKSPIEQGTELAVIGNPYGLPTKIDDSAYVRTPDRSGYFVVTADTFKGNSGSAVINLQNGQVEGVLVRGARDFQKDPRGCLLSRVCDEKGCRGEDVTKVSSVIPHLPQELF